MPEKIAGIPRTYVLVGGALIVGIVGYAYFSGSGTTEEVTDTGLEAAVDEYESPLGNSGTNSTGDYSGNVDDTKIDTNAEWTQSAVDFLQGTGYDSATVVNALGKYLSFKALSAAEAQIVMAARAAVGDPPVGGPYPIKDALPTTSTPTTPAKTTQKAPTGLKATNVTKTYVKLDWAPLTGVKGYALFQNGQRIESVVFSSSGQTGLKSNTTYRFFVRGIYPGNTLGPASSTVTVKTKK